ncbi:MAG: DNA polymerase III subunit alpha [bacterium]
MFTHLHLHTQYSLLEGAIRVKQLAKVLKERGFSACAITDHGNLFGAVEFYQALEKENLKPLIGMGAFVSEVPLAEHPDPNANLRYFHTQLLCQNRQGYQNLTYLASLGFTDGKRRGVPLIDHILLERYREGLIVLSGGMEGELGSRILNGRLDDARQLAQWYADLFPGRYYLELQNTGLAEQEEVNQGLMQLAGDVGLPLVGTNNCFYLNAEEAEAQHILRLMGMQRKVTDRDAPQMLTDQCYLKTEAEMQETFMSSGLPLEALENTATIAASCELSLDNSTYYLPQFEIPQGYTLDSWLEYESHTGLEQRLKILHELYQSSEPFEEFRKSYDERLSFELRVINQMKFPGYFLIVAEFINWAKDNGVSVGPGRGSGAGSLVAYALRITDVDPLRYGLLFERFLNPDRISMPDFDIDFDVEGRDSVIEHVRETYGSEKVCQISTFGSLKAKAVVRGVARVMDFPFSEADKIAKLVPNELNISLQDAIDKEPELARMEREGTENEQKLIRLSKSLENLSTHLGTHAAGVIIMDQDIREVMPVCTGKDNTVQSMFAMKYAEDQGAVKFDFLGLLNLSVIDKALELINRNRTEKEQLDLNKIPMDDELTFELFCRADTTGVFQLESSGMKKLLLDMRPSVFEDIVAILALYRPGPLGSGMVEDFVQCKHGRKKVVYPHPLMAEILKETYGVMVYQEQIMQGVQVLAKFTLGQSDLLRRAIGKKIPEVLAEQRQKFVEGCCANPEFVEGVPRGMSPEEKANEIFDLIDYFSGYGFNKSHTVAYGLISYQTAYLKAHYPVQFMAAVLNSSITNPDKIVNFIGECKEMKIRVLPPDVREGRKQFTVTRQGYRVHKRTLLHLEQFQSMNSAEPLRNVLRHLLTPMLEKDFGTELEFLQALQTQMEVLKKTLDSAESQILQQLQVELQTTANSVELSPIRRFLRREARIEAVRFGLNAVKNVGGNAVDALVEARQEVEEISDFMEFLKILDFNRMNKRMLETLVKCGAFDSFRPNRAQLLNVLDHAIHLAQEFQRAEDGSQQSLFDLMDESEARQTETQLELPDIRDWSLKERLRLEKEALGFYVSGHPLDQYASDVKALATSSADILTGIHKEGDNVSIAGIVVEKTIRLTKNSEKFAIVRLEDLRGILELPIYSRIYSDYGHLLEMDEPLLVSGRISFRDDEFGLVADRLELLSQVRSEKALSMTICIDQERMPPEQLRHLRGIFQKYQGSQKVHFRVKTESDASVMIQTPMQVQLNPRMMDELEELWKEQAALFTYAV